MIQATTLNDESQMKIMFLTAFQVEFWAKVEQDDRQTAGYFMSSKLGRKC